MIKLASINALIVIAINIARLNELERDLYNLNHFGSLFLPYTLYYKLLLLHIGKEASESGIITFRSSKINQHIHTQIIITTALILEDRLFKNIVSICSLFVLVQSIPK